MSKAERMRHAYLHFDHHLWQAAETQTTAGLLEKVEIREGQSLEVLACHLTASWNQMGADNQPTPISLAN
jgi:hypothetical protein